MPKSLKIITIIGVLCMLVPFMVLGSFASAETVTEDGAEFIFRSFHGSWHYLEGYGDYYSFDTDNGYFNYIQTNIDNLQEDLIWQRLRNFTYELSLSGSPFVSFNQEHYGLFTMRNFAQSSLSIIANSSGLYDGRLHSMCLLFAVPSQFPFDVQDDYFSFTGMEFWDDSLLVPISVSVTEPVAPSTSYTVQLSGNGGGNLGSVPSVSFFAQIVLSAEDLASLQTLKFYALTWYHTPTYYNFHSNYAFDFDNQLADLLFVVSLVDMVSVNTGYETGYREGVTAGKQQGYDEGFTAGEQQGYDEGVTAGKQQGYDEGFTAGEQQGYDEGVTAGKQQANNTVTQNSASYLQGYQDGLNAPEYSFMSLIASVFDAPIRALFGYTQDGVQHPGLFSIDILGMNMGAFIASIFSLAVILTVLRLVLGGKS